MEFSANILDEHVAPGYSAITIATIPDLRESHEAAEHWLANHLLNAILRSRYSDHVRALVIGFLRRASAAFSAYHKARELTLTFVEERGKGKQPIRLYYDAIDAWEQFALQINMATDLFKHLNSNIGAFAKNDGSPEQRLYDIANQVKHTAGCLASGQCTDKDTVPLWLSNAGLNSFGIAVSYAEAAGVMSAIARLAERLQDPMNFANPQS
jgi:hypothetical protein